MIALELYRIAGLALNSNRTTPFSSFPNLIATRTYTVRGILIDRDKMVTEMHFLEHVCKMFLDCLPTINWALVRHLDCVLGVERGQASGIVVVLSFFTSFTEPAPLLPSLCRVRFSL